MNHMRLAVVSQIQPGSLRAHAINVIKTAGGFSRLGHDVRLYTLAPTADALGADPVRTYHEPQLHWGTCPGEPDDESFGRWAARTILADQCDAVYGRNFWAPLLTSACGLPSIVETHAHIGVGNGLLDQALAATRASPAMRAIITIAPVLRDHFIERGAEPDRVHVVPDGVDFELFTQETPSPFENPGPNIVYSGHLYDYKGIPTVIEAAALLPRASFHLVGGLPDDIARHQRTITSRGLTNVHLHGLLAHAQVPPFVQHADVLLLPPSAREVSKDWTSPVKLGEYLASGPPIVASRIPALVRAVPESMFIWFEPDDATSLARAISLALDFACDATGRASRLALARRLSYTARASRILDAGRLSLRGMAA